MIIIDKTEKIHYFELNFQYFIIGISKLGRLLVSVRGPLEALQAAKGGAHIADVEYPASALGTPYPLNILAVRNRLDRNSFKRIKISTNIGEEQKVRSSSCQAALGVALSGADYIKLGFAGLNYDEAVYLGNSIVRTIRKWFPRKKVYPAVFPEPKYSKLFDPLNDGPKLVKEINCDGLLIDTFLKDIGKGLMDYYTTKQLKKFVCDLHKLGKEAWLAGSIKKQQLPNLWNTGVDVICVRGAACDSAEGGSRFEKVSYRIIQDLIQTLNK